MDQEIKAYEEVKKDYPTVKDMSNWLKDDCEVVV